MQNLLYLGTVSVVLYSNHIFPSNTQQCLVIQHREVQPNSLTTVDHYPRVVTTFSAPIVTVYPMSIEGNHLGFLWLVEIIQGLFHTIVAIPFLCALHGTRACKYACNWETEHFEKSLPKQADSNRVPCQIALHCWVLEVYFAIFAAVWGI